MEIGGIFFKYLVLYHPTISLERVSFIGKAQICVQTINYLEYK